MTKTPARGRITVDLGAIEANYRRFAQAAEPGRCAAVIKANGYGLGAIPIAQRLAASGCRAFFVASVQEGIVLRQAMPEPEIYLFDGLQPSSLPELLAHRLTPVLNTPRQHRDWISSAAGEANLQTVWLVDSGMSRLGMNVDDCLALAATHPGPDLLMTHLACAEAPDHPMNARQLAAFAAVREQVSDCEVSIGNTAGSQMPDALPGALHRIGIGLFGSNPAQSPTLSLDEAVQVHGRVLQVRTVPAGTPAGYGAEWTSARESTLLTIGVGYADGYLRSLGDRGWAALAGQRLPLAGRVSMDYLVVDATDAATDGKLDVLESVEEVALIGDGVDIDALAAAGGTISYELLTRLGPRLAMRWTG